MEDFLILAVLPKINVAPKYLVPPVSLAQDYQLVLIHSCKFNQIRLANAGKL